MSGNAYLENYGAGDEKRERLTKFAAVALAAVATVAGATYFFLRNYGETRQAELFLNLLRGRNYQSAYALWGCVKGSPCENYTMARFMEDWGPGSDHSDLTALRITRIRGCVSGVIFESDFGGGVVEYLWVDRQTRNLGHAPPICSWGNAGLQPRAKTSGSKARRIALGIDPPVHRAPAACAALCSRTISSAS